MAFRCDEATLERLEWPALVERLAQCASTERGAESLRSQYGFAATAASALDRLVETAELRLLLDAEEAPPFGGVHDLRPALEDARRGALLSPAELARVQSTLDAGSRLARFFDARKARAPKLADLAGTLPDLSALAKAIASVVGPDGTVRDDASPALRRARGQVRSLDDEVEGRMARLLRSADVAPHLQDSYVTNREGRPVIPVRAEARGRVRGIVHDVSSSGTTVFIEPEAVVELGNRRRLAQLDVDREIERLLRQLLDQIRDQRAEIEAMGATLEALDRALARGRLSQRLGAAAPVVSPEAPLALVGLRHPLLLLETELEPEEVIANDVVLPEDARGLVVSGPNAGGKTVFAKAVGLAVLSVRAGLHVACEDGSAIPLLESVYADIGDEQDLRSGLSTFSARMSNLARITSEADESSLVIVDEIGEGTEPGEGAALAQAVLEALVERGARVITTTHFNRLKELAGTDARFANASAEWSAETLAPTYRVQIGAPGSSGATWVAARMGLDERIISRARSLIDGEDRKLEQLTRDLSELRQDLEAERAEAALVREQSESARAAYETRLDGLRRAREQALAAMKTELETAFESARDEIAGVMRDVQQGRTGQAANAAYRELERVREKTEAVEREHAEPEREPAQAVDWDRVAAGDRLRVANVSGEAVFVEGPDRHGRVVVRFGAARTTLAASKVERLLGSAKQKPAPSTARVDVERAPSESVDSECDLRGLRVDEALDRAEAYLQRVLGTQVTSVSFIHGHGTGALRSAIRSWLRELPYIEDFQPGAPRQGGEGVTVATLAS